MMLIITFFDLKAFISHAVFNRIASWLPSFFKYDAHTTLKIFYIKLIFPKTLAPKIIYAIKKFKAMEKLDYVAIY